MTETLRQWTADMICPDRARACAPRLRRAFRCADGHGRIVSATLYATALGVCEITLNGEQVTQDLLTPGWSSYEWRLRYAQWDVRDLIQPESVLGILIGAGWHSGRLGFAGGHALYGDTRAALLELHIEFDDGHVQKIVTDDAWESGPSDVLGDDLYDGERIDARLRDDTWLRSGPAPDGWSGVTTIAFDHSRLTPYLAPPIRRHDRISPQRIWASPTGATLIDFGQNIVGWTQLHVRGPQGATITLRHAEVLENEELGVRPLRTARATDTYILSGEADDFEPTLTFHGFRYAEISGWTGTDEELQGAISAVVIGSDLTRIGWFECSDPLLNRLHHNIVWSMRGNFVGLPTDCPQRDERLGWTGDLAAFITTAVSLYDVNDFLHDWLRDLATEQVHADGKIPLVVPDNFKLEHREGMSERLARIPHSIAALWNDAAVWVPWAAFEAYGDRTILEDEYPSMASYGRRIARALDADGILRGLQFGDWLDPDAPPGEPGNAKADPYVVATACVYRSARMIQAAAGALGRTDDEAEFAAVAERIRTAFNAVFVTPDGRIHSDAPTAYALAIAFGLLGPERRLAAGGRLAELVRLAGHRVTTGFAGTPFIAAALSDTDHLDDAYALLMQTECPSWLFPVTMGATTIWERWDSMLADGSINPGEMTSFNHYAFGAIGDWMHRVIGGLAPLEPGYRRSLIAPRPGGGLTWAHVALKSPFGRLSVRWKLELDVLHVAVQVPEGTEAVIDLPGTPPATVGPGQHRFSIPAAG